MLVAIVVLYSLIIFPIFIRVEGRFNKETMRLEYKIKLFKFITILFGYIETIDVGFAIHINNIKAVIVYYKDLISIRKKFEPLKDYHIYRFSSKVSVGSQNNTDIVLFVTVIYNAIANCFGHFVCVYKPYVKIKNDINVYENQNVLDIKVNFVVVLNFLMIILSLIKILWEKTLYAIKK